MKTIHNEKIIVLDFGSQYTQLIARRIRENGVYCEILPYTVSIENLQGEGIKGIILSGGPSSVYDDDAPVCSKEIFSFDTPILGICYGMQLMIKLLNGEVGRSEKREFGRAFLTIDDNTDLLQGLTSNEPEVWMSHSDKIEKIPDSFTVIAHTDNTPFAAIKSKNSKFYGVQYHPEVAHTLEGNKILQNFLFNVCKCEGGWTMKSFAEFAIAEVEKKAGSESRLLCGISGGVDSSVAAVLVNKAVGERLVCMFINNGLLRKGEEEGVISTYRDKFHLNVDYVDAEDRFLEKLKGVTDPEEKRKIIGREFIAVFEEEAKKLGNFKYLVQGTLYPDVIESVSVKGPSATIKTHHNVGGLPPDMKFQLIEPLRELFKDEVRALGRELSISDDILMRHPFPGPGLAVRILGEITKVRLNILKEADAIYMSEIKKAGLYDEIWQAFAVLLPVKTVGVMGDERTYENVIALRAVTSSDGMTADWAKIPYDILAIISNKIINEVNGVNRVVYDISSKPPGTIEWE